MAEFLKLRDSDDSRDLIHRAVHRLVEGDLVALPTETTNIIAANGLRPEAVQRLHDLARSQAAHPEDANAGSLLLGVKGAEEARDYLADCSQTGLRLMERGWPGPLILALPVSTEWGLLRELPLPVSRAVQRPHGPGWEVWFRVPKHEVVLSAMSLLPAPLILWEDRNATAEGMASAPWISELALIVEDEPGQNQLQPTVVRVEHDSWTLLEPGVVTESQLKRMTAKVILFVCTGNTCRSPLAEAICRKLLAERLECSPDELPERGYTVISAGLAASAGAPAAPESVAVARQLGADLETHCSQPLTDELLAQADLVFTMTQSHRDSILFSRPDVAERVILLSPDEADIPDPIGGGASEYEYCGREIVRHLQVVLDKLVPRSDGDASNPES